MAGGAPPRPTTPVRSDPTGPEPPTAPPDSPRRSAGGALAPRRVLAGAFLGAQVAAVAYARVNDTRYFCWAPFDRQNEYAIAVTVGGRPLSAPEVERRYRIRQADLESRSIAHVTGIVRYAEEHYYRDGAAVTVRYTVNGLRKPDWTWPPGAHAAPR